MAMALSVLLLAGSASAAIELTEENFDKEVFAAGKSAFIKFLAPWCGHCKKMKPDWDSLAESFASSDKVIIADVDCTTTGKSLCEKYGVRGYPTIKYFNPPDESGEDYKGGRDLPALKKFASELGPGCSVDALENCSAEQKAELDKYVAMPAADRDSKLTEMKAAIDSAEKAHEELLKQLQATYKESMEKLEKLKEDSGPTMKLLKAATPTKPKAKDEV